MVEPSGHCPYLGLKQNQAIRFASPTGEHRCYVTGQAQEIPVDQATYCLSAGHINCPLYIGLSVPTTATARAKVEESLPAGGFRSWMAGLAPRDRLIYGFLVGLLAIIFAIYAVAGVSLLLNGNLAGAPTTTPPGVITATSEPPSATAEPPTAVPPTDTPEPPSATAVPPTDTPEPPSATPEPPTAVPPSPPPIIITVVVPPTVPPATIELPTTTREPTPTEEPPSATPAPPTASSEPPTATSEPPTGTTAPYPPPQSPTVEPPTAEPPTVEPPTTVPPSATPAPPTAIPPTPSQGPPPQRTPEPPPSPEPTDITFEQQRLTLYFADATGTLYVPVARLTTVVSRNVATAALGELIVGPRGELTRLVPPDVRVLEARRSGDRIIVDFDRRPSWPGDERGLYAIALTLTEFSGVAEVQLLVNGRPVGPANGLIVRPALNVDNPQGLSLDFASGNRFLPLYFRGQGRWVRITRVIPRTNDVLTALVSALLDGPGSYSDRLQRAIPAGTQLRGVALDGNRAVVDLSGAFLEAPDRRAAVDAVVLSVTELRNSAGARIVSEVELLVDGRQLGVFWGADYARRFVRPAVNPE